MNSNSKYIDTRSTTIIKYEIRSFIGSRPHLFFPLYNLMYRFKRNNEQLVSTSTEIVIEGFPKSANSFAVAAFQASQKNPVKIAHHIHLPAQIIRSTQLKIPTLVLIRNPTDAIVSMCTTKAELNALGYSIKKLPPFHQLLKYYITFYSTIKPYKDSYTIGYFKEVTADFGKIIHKINKKFDTDFSQFSHTPDNVNSVLDTKGPHAGPSSRRKELKNHFLESFNSSIHKHSQTKLLSEQATDLYNRFM